MRVGGGGGGSDTYIHNQISFVRLIENSESCSFVVGRRFKKSSNNYSHEASESLESISPRRHVTGPPVAGIKRTNKREM